jgi:hypothetical protein
MWVSAFGLRYMWGVPWPRPVLAWAMDKAPFVFIWVIYKPLNSFMSGQFILCVEEPRAITAAISGLSDS